ncbi:MAG TPA: glycosyltransferase family 4 protein [Verrucomicrobiae bacterium]|jgi:glycosyltransferase involved in cell wall biosynthesis
MNAVTIGLSSAAGDPRLATTWSGTPANLVSALREVGVTVIPIDGSLPRPARALCRVTDRILGLPGADCRGFLARVLASKRVNAQCRAAGVKRILHTGTLDLPLSASKGGLERYIYCDSTWNLWSRYALEAGKYSARAIRIFDRLEKASFTQARHLFPIGHYVKENLIAHYGIAAEKISPAGTGRGKIPPFLGYKDYATGPILFVAKDRFAEKGGQLLLDSFALAVARNPNCKLVLAGKGAVCSPRQNVTIAGHVSWEELQRLFETAALFAMPAFNEAWGMVYLEAFACKTPILGLRRNSIPELTQNGRFGFVVDEPEPKQVCEAILTAVSNPQKLAQMGEQAQSFCLDGFSWVRTATLIRDHLLKNP